MAGLNCVGNSATQYGRACSQVSDQATTTDIVVECGRATQINGQGTVNSNVRSRCQRTTSASVPQLQYGTAVDGGRPRISVTASECLSSARDFQRTQAGNIAREGGTAVGNLQFFSSTRGKRIISSPHIAGPSDLVGFNRPTARQGIQ